MLKFSIPILEKFKDEVLSSIEYDTVLLYSDSKADNKMNLLEGWVPKSKKQVIDKFLNKNKVLHIITEATKNENVPILLHNNKFGKLFEPIGKLFALPSYSEIDLTILFAPFFMMFFGFCLGDAGYGLFFIIGAGLYKLKANKEFKPILSLIQLLGIATTIFGIISGTFMGINLLESNIEFVSDYKNFFLKPENMFNLALVLGAFQIIFGVFIKAFTQIKQKGFKYSLSILGWLIIFCGCGLYLCLTQLEMINTNNTVLYVIFCIGGFFIFFFSDIEKNIPTRFALGIWDIYATITGVFGDILSYIRLFALGLSSAILGFVINDIALQFLELPSVIGPILFVVFLLLGHTLNILISSLGSFVHPMRLTFVEFYKNAGFKGGGKEYKPFSN